VTFHITVTPGDYMVPFEDEVGSHPTLEEMQDIVVTKKKRPQLKESWYKNEVKRVYPFFREFASQLKSNAKRF
jgi:hypothetical protein